MKMLVIGLIVWGRQFPSLMHGARAIHAQLSLTKRTSGAR